MATDPSLWNESTPAGGDPIAEGDDELRSGKGAVRGRMALEHHWPASQGATASGGRHNYVSLSLQGAAPALANVTGTAQVAALYVTSGNHLVFEDSAGTNFMFVKSAVGVVIFAGTGTTGVIPYITTGGGMAQLTASAPGLILVTMTNTGAPIWTSAGVAVGISTKISSAITGDRMERGANQAIGNGASTAVSFVSAFANTSYSLAISWNSGVGNEGIKIAAKAAGSFTALAPGNGGNFDWIAVGT